MKTGRWVDVLDPYEWLPGYGETGIEIRTEGIELIVTITYDCDGGECERELRFHSVCSYHSQAFPGPSMLKMDMGDAAPLLQGLLIEFPDSEASSAWAQHYGDSRAVRHYSIAFMAENRLLTVFAETVSLGQPVNRSR